MFFDRQVICMANDYLPVMVFCHGKEVSTNNCCKFMAIFIVFPGFCLKQLQQLFSDNSKGLNDRKSCTFYSSLFFIHPTGPASLFR